MSNESPAPQPTSYLTALPFIAKEDGTVTDVFAVPSPWGAPLVSGMKGLDVNKNPWLCLINETPIGWLRIAQPLAKHDIEMLHMQRFAVDHRLATREELYEAVVKGSDPPDLYALKAGSRTGWELTSFTISQRRFAQALFFKVVGGISGQQRHRIGHLSGYQIYMWFGSADDIAGLPFRENDSIAYDLLIEALVNYRPDPSHFSSAETDLPTSLDLSPIVRTPQDVSFYAMPLLDGVPASGLFAMTGMSLGLAFQSDHKMRDEWDRLRRLISNKDRPENDCLLVSVGAPDLVGRCFLSEEVLAEFMLSNPEPIATSHLSEVVLHFWSTGKAVRLRRNGVKQLWPSPYTGQLPAVHPFGPNA